VLCCDVLWLQGGRRIFCLLLLYYILYYYTTTILYYYSKTWERGCFGYGCGYGYGYGCSGVGRMRMTVYVCICMYILWNLPLYNNTYIHAYLNIYNTIPPSLHLPSQQTYYTILYTPSSGTTHPSYASDLFFISTATTARHLHTWTWTYTQTSRENINGDRSIGGFFFFDFFFFPPRREKKERYIDGLWRMKRREVI
jgi:hypothetical protein